MLSALNPAGGWDLAIDPIDGSGSIGIGAPLGLLFSVLPASDRGFLRSGRAVVAAGYASFGHSCDFGFSLGQGVQIATLLREEGRFRITRADLQLADQARTIAVNASNERYWPAGLQAWAGGCGRAARARFQHALAGSRRGGTAPDPACGRLFPVSCGPAQGL